MGSGCNRLNLLYLQGTKRKSHRWLSHCVDGYRQSFIPSKTVRFLFIFNSVSDASFCTAVIAFCFFGRVEQQSKELLVAAARRRAAMQQAVSLTIVYSVMSILYFYVSHSSPKKMIATAVRPAVACQVLCPVKKHNSLLEAYCAFFSFSTATTSRKSLVLDAIHWSAEFRARGPVNQPWPLDCRKIPPLAITYYT